MRRRELLQVLAASAAGGVFFRSPSSSGYGEVPASYSSANLPVDHQVQSVLEIFFLGGLSPYETFYCVEEFGDDARDPQQWHAFLASGDVDEQVDVCGLGGGELLSPFAEDANGRTVNLGPFTMPLRERSDLLDRMRIVVTAHGALPHEVAIPLALTGRIPGNPSQAGLGAHIARYFDQTEGGGPHSYVLLPPSAIQRDLASPSAATGLHPGSTRPLVLNLSAASDFVTLLDRPGIDSAVPYDALRAAREAQFSSRLSYDGVRARARGLDDVTAVGLDLTRSPEIKSRLPSELLQPLAGSACGSAADTDATAMSLRMAAHLLTAPQPARYVSVVDGGFGDQEQAGGYDTHDQAPSRLARNLTSTLRSLAGIIRRPGETSAGKIDLDKTLVILNTEFGRTPRIEGNKGRGHWPGGYAVSFLGGPIRAANRGIYGAIGPDAIATQSASPVAHRMAALLALGIWPFAQESFNVSDVPGVSSEGAAAEWLVQSYLGVRA